MVSIFDPRIEKKLLFYASLGFLFVRMLILQQYVTTNPFFVHPISDSEMYLQWADAILAGKNYFAQEYHHPPGYAAFLAPLLWISGSNLYAVLVMQCILVSIQSLFVFFTAKRLFGVKPAWIAFLIYCACGPVIFYSMKILSETLYTTLVLESFFLLVHFFDARKSLSIFLCGLFLGCAIEVRGNAAILFWPSLLVPFVVPGRIVQRVFAALLLCAGVGIVTIPVLVRNVNAAHAWTPVASNWGENFYFGNNSKATGGVPRVQGIRTNIFDQIADVQAEASKRAGRSLSSIEAQRFWFREGLSFIKNEPLAWLRLEWIKLRRMVQDWLPSGIYSYPLERKIYHPFFVLTIGYGLLFPLFAVGWMGMPFARKTFLFLIYLALQLLVLLLYWAEERYLLSAVPFLIMGAGCMALITKEKLRNPLRIGGAAVLLAFCIYANVNAIQPGGMSAWYSNASAAHFTKREFRQSAALALEALKLDANHAEAWTNLGSALYSMEKIPQARKAWQETLRIDPTDVMANRNLAISYEKENRIRALEFWEQTLSAATEKKLPAETIARIRERIAELKQK